MTRPKSVLQSRFPSLDDGQLGRLWLCAKSLKRTDSGALDLLEDLDNLPYEEIVKEIFTRNLDRWYHSINSGFPVVAVWWRPGCFGSQLTPIAKAIEASPKHCYLGVVDSEYLEDQVSSRSREFDWANYLVVPHPEDMAKLDFLQAVVLSEGYIWKTYLPPNVIRIAQPHGLDVSYISTIKKYGGPLVFDYVLSPMYEIYLDDDYFSERFPREVIEHNSDSICIIPAGYAKLDHFVKVCNDRPKKKKIIYHISLMGLESPEVRGNIGRTIKLLLDNFRDREILFRCDPRDRDNPELNQQIQLYVENPRFTLSKASSYVEDYADAELLVTHRTVTAHTFAFASGRPIIALERGARFGFLQPKRTFFGYVVTSENQLLKLIRAVLEHPEGESERILKHRDRHYPNVGGSAQYLVDNLDFVLGRKRHPDWKYFGLDIECKEGEASEKVRRSLRLALREGRGTDYVCLGEASALRYPYDAEVRFNASKLNARVSNPFLHKVYFNFWYRSIQHLSSAWESVQQSSDLACSIESTAKTQGLMMALGVRWHAAQWDDHSYDTVNQILDDFNRIDSRATFYLDHFFKVSFKGRLRSLVFHLISRLIRLPGLRRFSGLIVRR